MKLFNQLHTYLFIGILALMLLAIAQVPLVGSLTQRGPGAAYAEGDKCDTPGFDECPEPGFEGQEAPTPVESTPVINTPPVVNTPAAPTVCNESRESYNQCAGTAGLESYPANHTISVTRVRDCNGNVVRYENNDLGIDGQCGSPAVSAPAPEAPVTPAAPPAAPPAPAPVTPTQVCVPNAFNSNTCARCAADGTWEGTPGSDFGPSNGSAAWCGCAAKYNQSAHNQYCQVPVAPAPVAAAPAAPTQQANPNIPQCNGTIQVTNGAAVCVTQNTTQQVEARGGSAIANATITNSGNSNVRTEVTREIVREVPIVTSSPVAIQVASVVCPANTTKKVVDQKIVCEVNRPTVVLAGVSEAKELPKTGLPIAAWAIGAFIPAGLKLRRFSILKGDAENDPNYLWETRQFNK